MTGRRAMAFALFWVLYSPAVAFAVKDYKDQIIQVALLVDRYLFEGDIWACCAAQDFLEQSYRQSLAQNDFFKAKLLQQYMILFSAITAHRQGERTKHKADALDRIKTVALYIPHLHRIRSGYSSVARGVMIADVVSCCVKVALALADQEKTNYHGARLRAVAVSLNSNG